MFQMGQMYILRSPVKPPGKNIASSDRFLLQPTGETKKYSLQQMEAAESILSEAELQAGLPAGDAKRLAFGTWLRSPFWLGRGTKIGEHTDLNRALGNGILFCDTTKWA